LIAYSLHFAFLLSSSLRKKASNEEHTVIASVAWTIAEPKGTDEQPMKTELALLPVLTQMAGDTGCKLKERRSGPSPRM
jgi:cell division inhibitor SulA